MPYIAFLSYSMRATFPTNLIVPELSSWCLVRNIDREILWFYSVTVSCERHDALFLQGVSIPFAFQNAAN